MNAHVQITADIVIGLYKSCRTDLEKLSTSALNDLQHVCDDLRFHEEFSIRTAAEINRAGCVMILEERKGNAALSGAKENL